MPGLRILNIHPRIAGPIARWREAIEIAAATGFNAVWLNPFHGTSRVVFEDAGKRRQHSLYAIRDHEVFDAAVSSGDAARDRAALARVVDRARELGIRMMVDLVLNHVAVDHPLVVEEDARVRAIVAQPGWRVARAATGAIIGVAAPGDALELLFARNDALAAVDFDGTTGYDNVQVNFESPRARRYFLDGEGGAPGAWRRLVERYLELGFGGFRCDMAYKVPAAWWQDLIGHARGRDASVVFLAETLGGKEQNHQLGAARLVGDGGDRPAFDLVMLSTPWWDMQSAWLGDEIAASYRLSYHGGAGSPDTHDLEHTLAQRYRREVSAVSAAVPEGMPAAVSAAVPEGMAAAVPEVVPAAVPAAVIDQRVAELCVRNYALVALVSSSVFATMSYLFCLDQSTVFWDPDHLAQLDADARARGALDHPLNLSRAVTRVNRFLAELPLARARVELAAPPRLTTTARAAWVALEVVLGELDGGGELGRVAIGVDLGHEHGRGARADEPAGAPTWMVPPLASPEQERGARWLELPLLVARFTPSPRRAAPSS